MVQSISRPGAALLAAVLVFAWLAYLILTGQPQFELTVFKPALTLQFLNTALIGLYAGHLFVRRRLPGPTRLDLPLAALLAVYAAAIAMSIYPRVSLEASLPVAMALITFYVFHDVEFLQPGVIVRGLAVVGAIAGGYALWRVGENYLDWLRLVDAVEGGIGARDLVPPAVPRVTNVGDNVNVLAMALNLTLPFALALTLSPERRFERAAGAVSAVLILAALFFTLSRGAWLGTIAALGVFGLLYLLRGLGSGRLGRLRRRIPAKAVTAAAVAGVIVIVVAAAGVASWDSRPEWLFRPSLSPRYDAAKVGLQIVRDRPLLGSGPYTYPLLYNVYSGEYPVENIHPHNGYVNILVDIGVLGGLVLLAGGVVLAATLYGRYTRAGDTDPAGRVVTVACIASLASLAVHSLADSPNVWTTSLLPLAAVLALSLRGEGWRDARPSRPLHAGPRLLLLALPVILIALWVRFDFPHASFDASVHHLAEGEFEPATAKARDAADGDGSNAAYHINEGVNLAILHLVTSEQGRRPDPDLLAGAERSFLRAISLEPRGAVAHANLALTRLLLGDGSAPVAARTALYRAPTDGAIAAAAGTVLEWAGFTDEAAYAYGIAVWRDPALVQSPFWLANPARIELRGPAISSSGLTACEIGRVDALFAPTAEGLASLADGCRDLVVRQPANARARADLAVILAGLGRDADAVAEARIAANQVPDNPFIRTSLAIALAGEGDLLSVRHELVIASHLGDPDASLLLAYTYEPPAASTPVIARIKAVARPGELPGPVLDRLRDALPASAPMVFDNGVQRYTLGVLYYRVRFLRESPTSILVPGEWLGFASPRTLLIVSALKKR